jgi:mono/diheme cytochrome c family protein
VRRWGGLIVAAWALLGSAAVAGEPAAAPDFVREVQPILVARCVACHGAEQQESGLRLDRREDGLRGGDSGAAIVPGDSEHSPLMARITASDADVRMPPEGERLSEAEVGLVRRWIDAGATWPAGADLVDGPRVVHWSLAPLVLPEVPAGGAGGNPIDSFVAAKLAAEGMEGSAAADRRTLLRRVTIDLTGLLPTPEEMQAFLADMAPGAYERVVERLLASPRYGERWARHWMDVVHFAETHGHDQDRPRPNAWPYRDYLIRAFNDDKPYARFVAEQVAGDVLYPDDPAATVALGFLAAGPWDESSLMCIVDDTVDKKVAQLLDRDDMITNVMSTFASATVHCARCHNHKFDPITQGEYYALQAVFAGVDRAERPFDPDPAVHLRRRSLLAEKGAIATRPAAELLGNDEVRSELAKLEKTFRASQEGWVTVVPTAVTTTSEATVAMQADGSVLFGGARPEKDTYTLVLPPSAGTTAVRLEVLCDPSLPQNGPGRQDNGNFHLNEFKLHVTREGKEPEPVTIAAAYADIDQGEWTASAAIDGKAATAWRVYPEVGKPHAAVFVLASPLAGEGACSVVLEQTHGTGHVIGRLRLAVSEADGALLRPLAEGLKQILAKPAAERTDDERAELARMLLTARVERELAQLPPPQMVYAAASEFKSSNNFHAAGKPRPVHVLRRGDIHQPLEEAQPGALACVAGVEVDFSLKSEDEGARRKALAAWLVDQSNVLTWRSIVNRVWHFHFDRGIVDTPSDLGRMGGEPSHPKLLDWLAVWFRDGGGSFKDLHRLIVSSQTYRQTSAIDERASADGGNRWLWRMNRRRLDAESIRDAVLQLSGKLDLTMGGPSVRQFVQTPGIHVTPSVDYRTYDVDAPENFRRAVYRFLFRTIPDPLMESLDCPDGSQLTAVRSSSMTALQALSLLDNRFVVRQSEHAAARFEAQTESLAEQIRLLFAWALQREPTAQELAAWEQYAQRHGLANACRMMINTNEFVFVD